ncbi:MAG: YwaF family protein, partial [Oscillospiraceae bacterium]
HYTIPVPRLWGIFHITVLCVAIAGVALIIHYGKNITKKQLHWFLGLSACIYIVLEIYKQFIIQFVLVDGALVLQLQWYSLPVFFCSLPIYLLPIAVIAKKDSVADSALSFLAIYGTVAALVVLAYPEPVFFEELGLTLQTMTVHTIMLLDGIMIMMYKREELTLRFFRRGVATFFILVAVAISLSVVVHLAGVVAPGDRFYPMQISPFYLTPLPVLRTLQENVPYPLFLASYCAIFTCGGALFYQGQRLFVRWVNRRASNRVFTKPQVKT